jgi:hypothetical protein
LTLGNASRISAMSPRSRVRHGETRSIASAGASEGDRRVGPTGTRREILFGPPLLDPFCLSRFMRGEGYQRVWALEVPRRRATISATMFTFNSNPAVPQTPVRFRLPAACDFCQARGTLVPGTTVQGSTVVLTWVCRECGQDRPITRGEEQAARRSGPPERPRKTRKIRHRPL